MEISQWRTRASINFYANCMSRLKLGFLFYFGSEILDGFILIYVELQEGFWCEKTILLKQGHDRGESPGRNKEP